MVIGFRWVSYFYFNSHFTLQAYWERGYAYPITYEMSCVILEEMFKEMDAAKLASEGNSR